MKFGHAIKYNGTMYPAGTEVPVKTGKEAPEKPDGSKGAKKESK